MADGIVTNTIIPRFAETDTRHGVVRIGYVFLNKWLKTIIFITGEVITGIVQIRVPALQGYHCKLPICHALLQTIPLNVFLGLDP